MGNRIKELAVAIIMTLLGGTMLLTVYSLFDKPEIIDDGGLYWIRSEGYFVDYSISGDKIHFRYALCFENTSEHDYKISPVGAEFSRTELKDWLEYEKFLTGNPESGEYYTFISSGEKRSIIFIFEGQYLGGVVNENLSAPKEVLFIQEFADALEPR